MLNRIGAAFLNEFLLISIGAFLSFLQVSAIFGNHLHLLIPAALSGFLTLSFYQTHKWVNYYWERWKKVEGHAAVPRSGLILLVYLVTLFFIWKFSLTYPLIDLLFLIPALVLGILYVTPAFRDQLRLRDLRLFKIFIISFTWAWVTGIWPVWLTLSDPGNEMLTLVIIGLERISFIFALTVPFDIRDMHLDKVQGTATLPLTIGIRRSKWIAYSALIFHFIVLTWLLCSNTDFPVYAFPGLYMTGTIAWLLIRSTTPERPDHYFTGFIDGCILVEALYVLVFLY